MNTIGNQNTELCYDYCTKDWTVGIHVILKGTLTNEQITEIVNLCYDDECFVPKQVGLPEWRPSDVVHDDEWFAIYRDSFSKTYEAPTIDIDAQDLYRNFTAIESRDNWKKC